MIKKACFSFVLLLATVLFPGSQAGSLRAADSPSPEELVAAHIKSLTNNPALLAKITSITFLGTVDVDFIQGMQGTMTGTTMIFSQGPNMALVMKFGDINNYPGEYFAYDGKKVTVAHIKPGLKSPLADFLYRHDKIMKHGVLGGVLSNAWPLLDIKNKKANMKVSREKVDGQELYKLEYRPKDGGFGPVRVNMYFDPATYRHVRTVYRVRTDNDASTGFNPEPDTDMAIGQVKGESYYTLTEKFADFKKVGPLTLPHSYTLDYMIDGTAQSGFVANWKLTAKQIGFNSKDIDPKIFQAEK